MSVTFPLQIRENGPSEAGPRVNGTRPLTTSSGTSREGLAVDATRETWLPIPGYEGTYEVSDLGRIRSRPRERTRGDILKTPPNKRGYPEVHLYGDNRRTWHVHVLVCLAFLGPCPDGLEIRHYDDDKSNLALTNLSYGTRSENVLDRVRLGTHNEATKRRCIRGHDIANPANIYVNPSTGSRQCRACVRWCWAQRKAVA